MEINKKEFKVTLVKGKTFRLKPNYRYLMVLDPKKISPDTAQSLIKAFGDLDIKLLVAWLEEGSYKIIEEKK